jgi:ATP-dependent Clp protease ATP-binding subunit ClpA
MFERFTDRARRVLVLAQDEARAMEHNFLGTEHILLGLVAEGEGVGAKALTELGVAHDDLRNRIVQVVPQGDPGTASGAPPFTPRSKQVLELALKEALEMNHNYIGTEHLLLGLIREASGVAAQVLIASGLDLTAVRAKVLTLLAGFVPANPFGRTTPAGGQLATRARALAATEAVGSQHFLLGILEDPGSLGARVLGSLGVTKEAVSARVREIGVGGTTDEMPAAKRATTDKPFRFDLGPNMTLSVDDPELARKIAVSLTDATKAGTDLGAVIGSLLADAVAAPPAAEAADDEPPEEDAAKPASE